MDLKAIYLHIINIDDDNFYDDPKPIMQVHLTACCNRYKQCITCKKRHEQRINACSMKPSKLVELVYSRKLKKKKHFWLMKSSKNAFSLT